jgi:peptidoglycan/xylan/chitin deacetylase (PgdA/CDA1 family)
MQHRNVRTLSEEEFRNDIATAFATIADITGKPCAGYRAPWFSLAPDKAGALEALRECGATYDASLRLPINAPVPDVYTRSGLRAVPVPLVPYMGRRIGVLGGLALRLLPRRQLRRLLATCDAADRPACLYLHPYEWTAVPGVPHWPTGKQLRRRLAVRRTLPRLHDVAHTVRFTSIAQWLDAAMEDAT